MIADIETAFNTNDPDLAVRHFTADASGVGVTGALLSGWPALFEAHRQAYAGPLRDQRARYDVAGVVFLRPDDRVIEGGGAMIALYVLVKQDGRWWIAPPPEHPGPVGGIRRSTHSRRTPRAAWRRALRRVGLPSVAYTILQTSSGSASCDVAICVPAAVASASAGYTSKWMWGQRPE